MSTTFLSQLRPQVASTAWRLGRSRWLLIPLFGVACLGGAALVSIGVRARRPAWWIAGTGYLTAGVTCLLLLDEPGRQTAVGRWAVGVLLLVWAATIAHAWLINPAWLRWQASGAPSGGSQPGSPLSSSIELNSATAGQLAALPGFDAARARRVLAGRQARQGFRSLDEFAAAAGLAAPEFVRVRALVYCAPTELGPWQLRAAPGGPDARRLTARR